MSGLGARPRQAIMVVAGEQSGDGHAAQLVAALRALSPELEIFGMGGSALRKVGMETVVDSEESASVMGVVEVARRLPAIWRAFRSLLAEERRRRPCLAILVDFPDFNLRLARALHRRQVRILYYITPQLWAWRRRRIALIRRYVAQVVPIFPFEERFFRRQGVAAEYLGHPALDAAPEPFSRQEYLSARGLDPRRPLLALLPGSRRPEVERLIGPMLGAAARLRAARPELQVIVPVARSIGVEWLRRRMRNEHGVLLVPGEASAVLRAADAAVVASGTASLEAALAETPFVTVYRLSPLTYLCARLLVRVPYFAMPNLIAGRKVVEELLQSRVTPAAIAAEIEPFIAGAEAREAFRTRIRCVRRNLEVPAAAGTSSERAARLALALMEQTPI